MVEFREHGNVAVQLSGLAELRPIHTTQTEGAFYQHPTLGRVLILNGEIQHVEAWEPLYHEPLVHLPSAFIEGPQTALVIGGGSFFAVREVLRYRSIERVLMLDHDAELLAIMTEEYEDARIARTDPRLEIRTTDAFRELPHLREQFDLVVNDSVDLLTVENAYQVFASLLTSQGVCSDLIYRHIFESTATRESFKRLGWASRHVASLVFVPEYPGILHLLLLWGKSPSLIQDLPATRNCEQLAWCQNPRLNPCRYFDPRFLKFYLHLPRCVREKLPTLQLTDTLS